MSKFDPKNFTGKNRIERSVSNNPGIYRLWVWDEDENEYLPPPRGNSYVAIRKRTNGTETVSERSTFSSLDQARSWKNSATPSESILSARETPKFRDVVLQYRRDRLPQLRPSTQESYEKMLKIYFEPLQDLMISEITPIIVDQWVQYLQSLPRTSRRKSFRHELDLLSGLFRFYAEYDDDFESPLRPRHRRNIHLASFSGVRNRNLSDKEFFSFRQSILKQRNGKRFAALATIQFFQALRISEAAGLKWEDIEWDLQDPSNCKIRVSRSVFFSRTKGKRPELLDSFKNSKSNQGMKTLPLMKESFQCLIGLQDGTSPEGLIFNQDTGELLTYRQIQKAYDSAFQDAGLPYSGTHIMRHGGASYVYNKANGDLSLVQAITGNRDYKSALTYAHRNPLALSEFARKEWKEDDPQISTNDDFNRQMGIDSRKREDGRG